MATVNGKAESESELWQRVQRESAINRRFAGALAQAREEAEDGNLWLIQETKSKRDAAIAADRKAHGVVSK